MRSMVLKDDITDYDNSSEKRRVEMTQWIVAHQNDQTMEGGMKPRKKYKESTRGKRSFLKQ